MLQRMLFLLVLSLAAAHAFAQSKLPKCPGTYTETAWTNCFGELTRPSGLKFVAEFRNGKPNGQGTVFLPNGDKYVGEFKDGTQDGKGEMTWTTPDGKVNYVGYWREGEMHGSGTWTSASGKYVGQFLKGKRHGQGTEYRADGTLLRKGTWQNGDFARP
jgi:hypothetical protein